MYYFTLGFIISFVATFLLINSYEKFTVIAYNETIQYTNSNNDASGRARIQDTVALDNEIKYRYKNAFYYEYGNREYLDKLKTIFNISENGTLNTDDWKIYDISPNTPSNILMAYNNCVNELKTRINTSDALTLPDNVKIPIQIVHDVLLRYGISKKHPSSSVYSFDIEMILYRQSKYQGKHIGTRVIYDNDKNILNVLGIGIIGVVSEDNIGLFPVVANNPFEIDQLSADLTEYPIIIPTEDYTLTTDKTNTSFWKVT